MQKGEGGKKGVMDGTEGKKKRIDSGTFFFTRRIRVARKEDYREKMDGGNRSYFIFIDR